MQMKFIPTKNIHAKKRVFAGFFALLFLFFFSPLVFAASAQEEALKYVSESDAAATNVTSFQSDGGKYHVVSIASVEVMVLEEKGGIFSPIQDNATLIKILPSYIGLTYSSFFTPADLDKLKADYSELNATFGYCDYALSPFLANSFMIFYIQQIDDRGSPVPKTKLAIDNLKGNATIIPGSSQALKDGFNSSSQKISSLSPQSTPDELKQAMGQISSELKKLAPIADKYSADYNLLETRHPDMLRKRVCALKTSSFDAVFKDLNIGDAIPSETTLAAQITASTPKRLEILKIKGIYAEKNAKYLSANALFKNVNATLNESGLDLSAYESKIAKLKEDVDKLKTTTSLQDARNTENSFEDNYNATYSWLLELNATTLASDILASVNATKSARNATAQAALRLGEGSDEITNLTLRIKTQETNLQNNLSLVQNPSLIKINAETFQNLTITAQAIEADANGLQNAWNSNTLLLVLAAIILIAVIAGSVIWYRQQKTLLTVSNGLANSEKEIDIRNLKKED